MNPASLIDEIHAKGGELETKDGKLIARHIPKAMLEPLRLVKSEIMALLAANDASPTSCCTCEHRTSKKSCGAPVLAGLAPHFQLVWHPADGNNCTAWQQKEVHPSAPQTKPLGLLEVIKRMAAFYQYTDDELIYALNDARQHPDRWRKLIKNDRHRDKFV